MQPWLPHCITAFLSVAWPALIHVRLPCRFYYAKGMNVDEAYVFVCYDSRTDRARFTPHTGKIPCLTAWHVVTFLHKSSAQQCRYGNAVSI